jgi:hypothetical protein
MHGINWLLWALVLFTQNISFTYVSRARSSGSLTRHLKASIFSNGIWIFSNMIMLGPMFDYLTGKHGHLAQATAGTVYAIACTAGSIFAHYWALRTEKGKDAVGFNKKYAQIPIEEWQKMKAILDVFPRYQDERKYVEERLNSLPTAEQFQRVRSLAEQAHDIACGALPDSGIVAQKFGDEIVTTGLPTRS